MVTVPKYAAFKKLA
jgi:hypothetical protein